MSSVSIVGPGNTARALADRTLAGAPAGTADTAPAGAVVVP
ncbi:hypothetical protein ACLVWQ_01105 [Streptomyces sp. CWNU-52B]